MEIYRPFRGFLFVYELFRLALLIGFFAVLASPGEEGNGGGFPYVVYVSANGLYPLMALFIWRDLKNHRNYLPLYGAGKVLGVFCFYLWGFFMIQSTLAAGDTAPSAASFAAPGGHFRDLIRLGGSFLISAGDLFSVLGCGVLHAKLRRAAVSAAGEV